jgi:hypothetical protein
MKYTADGLSYTFKVDGKEYPALFGWTVVWKQIDGNTWEITEGFNSKVVSVDAITLSGGKTMTIESKGTKPNGEKFDDTTVYQRVSGASGILGKWKTKNIKSSSPDVMEFLPSPPDGLAWNVPSQKASSNAQFDGKDYPVTGANFGPGFTIALKKNGPGSFESTFKHDGKPLYMSTYRVSADGKTMTETGSAAGVNERSISVYDRQ